jgi:hypothetical protein
MAYNEHGLRLKQASFVDSSGTEQHAAIFQRAYHARFVIETRDRFEAACINVSILNESGVLVSSVNAIEEGFGPRTIERTVEYTVAFDPMTLLPGSYSVGISVQRPNTSTKYLLAEDTLRFDVESATLQGAAWPYMRKHGIARIATVSALQVS